MLSFLTEEKESRIMRYWFVHDYLLGHISQHQFHDALRAFHNDIVPKMLTQIEFDQLVSVSLKESEKKVKKKELIQTALNKAIILERSSELFLRLMHVDEFKQIFRRGEIRQVTEATHYKPDPDVPYPFKKAFQGLRYYPWDAKSEENQFGSLFTTADIQDLRMLIDWDVGWEGVGSYEYNKFCEPYVTCIKNAKKSMGSGTKTAIRNKAMIEFRIWLVSYISSLMNISFNVKADDVEAECQRVKKEFKDKKFAKRIGRRRTKYFLGLCDHQKYLIQHAKKFKDILLHFNTRPPPDGSLLPMEEHKPYQIALFFKKSFFQDTKKYAIHHQWFGTVQGRIADQLLGCCVLQKNRSLCNDVVKFVTWACSKDKKNSIPVYNFRGNLYWPRASIGLTPFRNR